MKQARERIQEFERLQKARHLLDAISLINSLLVDGSEIEILSLAGIIMRRLNKLGVTNVTADKENGTYLTYMSFSLYFLYEMCVYYILLQNIGIKIQDYWL